MYLAIRIVLLTVLVANIAFAEDTPPIDGSEDSFWFNDLPAVETLWESLEEHTQNQEKPMSLPQLREFEHEYLKRFTDTHWDSVQSAADTRALDCMKVTSDETLCSCLRDELPVFISFTDYTALVIDPQSIHFDSSLSANHRQVLIDKTLQARESCVHRE